MINYTKSIYTLDNTNRTLNAVFFVIVISVYLYRVGAVNSAGAAFSGWTVAMTDESGEWGID